MVTCCIWDFYGFQKPMICCKGSIFLAGLGIYMRVLCHCVVLISGVKLNKCLCIHEGPKPGPHCGGPKPGSIKYRGLCQKGASDVKSEPNQICESELSWLAVDTPEGKSRKEKKTKWNLICKTRLFISSSTILNLWHFICTCVRIILSKNALTGVLNLKSIVR